MITALLRILHTGLVLVKSLETILCYHICKHFESSILFWTDFAQA